jgi:trans-aconitate 2-methyltransferase
VTDWDPQQYSRFADERRQPFDTLLSLLTPVPGGRAVDLGCGPGPLTVDLHHHLGAAETVGVDDSAAMLGEAAACAGEGVSFEHGDLAAWDGSGRTWDVVAASASLQWVPDHEAVLRRWTGALADGGQLAVQVPANADHVSHETIHEVLDLFGADIPDPVARNVLPPETYAEVLDDLGYREQHVRLQVFGHHLGSTADLVEWVKGTSLVRVRKVVDEPTYDRFLAEYRRRLLDRLGDRSPYFYAFKRILLWARR